MPGTRPLIGLLLAAAALPLGCGGGDDGRASTPQRTAAQATRTATASPTAQAAAVNRFDGARAFRLLRRQVEIGPRPAGSAASRRLAEELRRQLPRGRFEAVSGGLRNIVGRLPGRKPALVLAAHYDTKDIPDFVGANDGAGGTAAVLEIARVLRRTKRSARAPELRFVLFDGEESPDDSQPFYSSGLRGSRAYAARHAKEIRALVLLDFIADRDLSIPYEPGSDAALWRRLRAAARRAGVAEVFPDTSQGEILDDHTPFVRRGVPAIDLIDFDFPCWHRTCDDLTAVSEQSLDRSGEAVLELLRSWR